MPYLLHWKPNPKAHEALMPSELLTLLLNICLLPSMQTVSNGGYSEGTRDCWQCSLQPLFTVKESVTSSSNTKQLWMMPFQTDSFNHLPEWNVCSFSQKSSSSSPTQPPLLLFPSFFPDEFTSAKMAVSVPPPPPKKKKERVWANLPKNISSQCFQIHQVVSLSTHKSYKSTTFNSSLCQRCYKPTFSNLYKNVAWSKQHSILERCMLNLQHCTHSYLYI